MKKMDNTRSHSWWWDSHICPKNSKWLQENLSEMDSKVSAMLRIIEEDADSFAQRAEMYYKKRPELINLVEEFYRTYRALVERYTYLTREIRQNVAPALQAQLGMSSESAQNSPVDLHLKKGIDGPDIISPSYSYTGASEYDCYSPTEVSTKGQTDDEFSPLGFQTSYERRDFGFKSRYLNMEESPRKVSDVGLLQGTADADISQLQMELMRLQEENKDIVSKSSEDVAKLKDLQVDLSSLQSRVKGLEAEDKLMKKRLNSVQEKEQKLESENLKLSHALISSKEDRCELLEEKKLMMEQSKKAIERIQALENETVGLKAELLTAHSCQLESNENFKEKEEAVEKLQLTIAAFEEQKLKDLVVVEVLEQKNQELLVKLSEVEKENGILADKGSLQEAELQKMQTLLRDAIENVQISEQALHATSEEKARMEQDKMLAVSQAENLQDELERTKRERQHLAGDLSRLENTISKLEEEGRRLMSEKKEVTKHVCELETITEDEQRLIRTLHASCQQYEDRCKALEVKYQESNEKLLVSSKEVSKLHNQTQALQNMVSAAQLEKEDLQKKISSLAAEKLSLTGELKNKAEFATIAEDKCREMHIQMQDKKGEIEVLQKELMKHINMVNILEEELSAVSKEKFDLAEEQTVNRMAHQQLKDELNKLKQQVDVNATLTKDKLADIELEKANLVHEKQYMQQNLLELQAMNSVLSGECLESKNDLRASEEAAKEAQRELGLLSAEVNKLQGENHAKGEVLSSLMSDIETLEICIASLRAENDSLGESVKKHSGDFAALEASNNVLNARLSDLMAQNTTLAAHVTGKEKLANEFSNAQRQVVELEQECESKAAHNLNLQQQISSLEQQLGLLHADLFESSSKTESLEAIVEEQRNEISKTNEFKESLIHEKQMLFNDVAILKNMNRELEITVGQLTQEKVLLQEETSAHVAQCNELTQNLGRLEAVYEAAQKETSMLKVQVAESEEENYKKLLEFEGRLQNLRLKLSDMLASEASLAEQLVERIDSIHTLETALLDMQKNKSALNEDVNCLQQQVSSFRVREASLLAEVHDSADLITSLSTEIENLKQVSMEAKESEKRLSLEQEKALENCQVLQQKINIFQQDLQSLGEERALHLQDIACHSAHLGEKECEVKKLEIERVSLQHELSRAQHIEHMLKEDKEKLKQDTEKLSCMLDSHCQNMKKQEEELCSLKLELSIVRNEQQIVVDKMKVLAEDKRNLEQKFKEREQELEDIREDFMRLQTNFNELQQVTASINIEISDKVEEARVLRENMIALQAMKSELEYKLHLWSKQALEKEDKEKALEEMLSVAQQKITALELQIANAQKRMIETIEKCERHTEDINARIQELAAVSVAKKELEQEFATLQEENTVYRYRLEKLQHELKLLQDHKEKSDSALKTAMLQRHEDLAVLLSLQEQIRSAADLKPELNGRHSESERKLQEEWIEPMLAIDGLKQQLAAVTTGNKNFEQELEKLQQELKSTQDQKAKSDLALRTAMLRRSKNMVILKSLQEQALFASDIQLDLASRYSRLMAALGTAERKLEKEIAVQKTANLEENSGLILTHKHVLELEDELHYLQAAKEDLIHAQASIKNHSKHLQEHVVDSDVHHSDQQEYVFKLSDQAKKLQDRVENVELELCKPVQLWEKNNESIQKMGKWSGDWMQSSINVKTFEGASKELDVRINESQEECDLKEVALQVQAKENVVLDKQNTLLTIALPTAKEENALLESKAAEENAAVKAVKQELFVVRKEKDEVRNLLLPKTREMTVYESQEHIQKFQQMISHIDDLQNLLSDYLHGKKTFVLQGNLSMLEMKQSNSQPTAPNLELRRGTSPKEVVYDGDSMKVEEANPIRTETMGHDQDDLIVAMENALHKLKESILTSFNGSHHFNGYFSTQKRLEDSPFLQGKSCNGNENLHGKAELAVQTRQEQTSLLQGEIGQLRVELELYKKEICQLKKVSLGEELQEKAEITHKGVKVVQRMLHELQENLVILEENVGGLKEELKMKSLKNRSLQSLLTDLQVKGLPCASLLKKKVLLLCKAMKIAANDWNEKAYDNKNSQIIEGIEKLNRAESLCIKWDALAEDTSFCIDNGLTSKPALECACILHQLQKRTEEVSILYEAVEAMLPASTSKYCKDNLPRTENDDPQSEDAEQLEVDVEEGDLIMNTFPEGLMHEGTERMINESMGAEKEVELFEGLAQFHINLGMRLHQALMDEKLENELQELKEDREKLKDDLQGRVEQVRKMEAELERLQGFLRGEEGEMLDLRQQKQVVLSKKRAEKKARRLSKELLLQRDHVTNLQDSLITWTKQQELATEMLEKKVFHLVSKECCPDMEGWDANQVAHLMQEMQSRKAITRRHSMDLQSVGQRLEKVGSSIESTQRQLLEGALEQEANSDRVSSETSPESSALELMKSQQKISRFGLAWLSVLFGTRSQRCFKGSLKDRVAINTRPSKHARRKHSRPSTIFSSLVAPTRKMSCCACGSSSDQLKSIDGKGKQSSCW